MFKREALQKYIDDGLISEQVHPENSNVRIYNYTQKCQYSGTWDEVTMKCRGLIYNWETNEQLSNPIPKFFNYEEHTQKGELIPTEIPNVFQKMDGWLGILYWLDGEPWIATRGSFASTGAVWATKWFRDNIDWENMSHDWTHVFEIITPITKIVVHYPFEGLVWLTARDIFNDIDAVSCLHKNVIPGLIPKLRGGDDIKRASSVPHYEYDTLKAQEKPNEEGFVLVYPSGLRLKIKFEEYKRLHRILTNVSPKSIWEACRDGQNFDGMLKGVPDEFFKWVNETRDKFLKEYKEIEDQAKEEFHEVIVRASKKVDSVETPLEGGSNITAEVTRADMAQEIKKMTNPGIGFSLLDKRFYSHIIWKLIKPKVEDPYKKEN